MERLTRGGCGVAVFRKPFTFKHNVVAESCFASGGKAKHLEKPVFTPIHRQNRMEKPTAVSPRDLAQSGLCQQFLE